MLARNRDRLLRELPDDAVVLDVGGWAEPFGRADWVLDLMPYETRGLYGVAVDPSTERFTADTWVQRDICDHEPWPFEDDQFDMVLCAQTLEDVRDPIWVCHELNRVAKAGYVEVPTRLAEQSAGMEGFWSGWSHHHWICDFTDEGGIDFTFKHHVVHKPELHLPGRFGATLTDERRVQGFFWEGEFPYRERILFDPAALEAELRATVEAHLHEVPPEPAAAPPASVPRRAARKLKRAVVSVRASR
ncbi:class I SAM-dependent methyltransferase [Conexibacter sp. SYSU D00693]|uniref:class I SAM-dependent methyltransferase n=1 Tax=Conexibacter sp. SYSU D00693 TaxID=2812560 RepID=UPI00196AB8E9|nr:class I SAM-dependent methyltransferase [Conexibacter sp. SYSU D00693]